MAPPRLDRRTVVVTRGKGGEDALSARLAEMGGTVRDLPAIEIGPPDSWAALDAALRELPRIDWAVFASVNAVVRTVERMDALGLPRAWLALRSLAAVGPSTAARLAAEVRAPDLVPGEATGAATAAALAGRVRGLRVLVPRPAEGRPEILDGLEAAGAEVLAPVVYRTRPAPPERLGVLAGWIEAGEVDAVAFASPSAVKAVVAALAPRADLLRRVLLAAIGPTTAAALREAGFPAGVEPERHTGRDLAEAIAGKLGPR